MESASELRPGRMAEATIGSSQVMHMAVMTEPSGATCLQCGRRGQDNRASEHPSEEWWYRQGDRRGSLRDRHFREPL